MERNHDTHKPQIDINYDDEGRVSSIQFTDEGIKTELRVEDFSFKRTSIEQEPHDRVRSILIQRSNGEYTERFRFQVDSNFDRLSTLSSPPEADLQDLADSYENLMQELNINHILLQYHFYTQRKFDYFPETEYFFQYDWQRRKIALRKREMIEPTIARRNTKGRETETRTQVRLDLEFQVPDNFDGLNLDNVVSMFNDLPEVLFEDVGLQLLSQKYSCIVFPGFEPLTATELDEKRVATTTNLIKFDENGLLISIEISTTNPDTNRTIYYIYRLNPAQTKISPIGNLYFTNLQNPSTHLFVRREFQSFEFSKRGMREYGFHNKWELELSDDEFKVHLFNENKTLIITINSYGYITVTVTVSETDIHPLRRISREELNANSHQQFTNIEDFRNALESEFFEFKEALTELYEDLQVSPFERLIDIVELAPTHLEQLHNLRKILIALFGKERLN